MFKYSLVLSLQFQLLDAATQITGETFLVSNIVSNIGNTTAMQR